MKTLNINNLKVVTDLTNSYFRNNRFMIGTSIPTEGFYNLGDIIINTSETSLQEPMWICIESGTPGMWQVFNASGEGGGRTVCVRNQVIIDSPASVIDLGIGTFDRSKDTLMVFINADYAYENVDYKISGTTIVAVDKEWNKVGMSDFTFDFVVFKSILDEGLSSSTELIYLKDYLVLEENTSEIVIGIDNYCKDTDILNVYKNSAYLTEDVDYITENNTMISLSGDWVVGDKFAFTVIKQVAKLVPEAVVYSDNIVDGAVTLNKLTEDLRDSIVTKKYLDAAIANFVSEQKIIEMINQSVSSNLTESVKNIEQQLSSIKNEIVDIKIRLDMPSNGEADSSGFWYDALSNGNNIEFIEGLSLDSKNNRINGAPGSVIFNSINTTGDPDEIIITVDMDNNYMESIYEKDTSAGTDTIEVSGYIYEIK